MHVALVVHDFDPNFGHGRYCVELARRLHNRCQFTVYANTFRAPEFPNVRHRRVPTWRYNALTTVLSFIPAAEWMLRRDRPDLIHCQGLTSWSADVITGHICNSARARSMTRSNARARLFINLVTPLERAFYRQRRARHLIAISHALEGEIRAEYGWNKPATVIYHGTDAEHFRSPPDTATRDRLRQSYGLPLDRWTWLFMGEAVKGLRQVIDQLPSFPHAHLLVISRSDFDPYIARARALGVLDRIVFHGFEPHPENAFQAVDAFVYPNDYDPFGMVASEAMVSGLPVILGRTIGVAELVQHGQNGLLCEPGNAESLAAQLRLLDSAPEHGHALGDAARATILEHSWDVCAEEVYQVYSATLAARARSIS